MVNVRTTLETTSETLEWKIVSGAAERKVMIVRVPCINKTRSTTLPRQELEKALSLFPRVFLRCNEQ
jgi:hypothetical protein